MRLEALALASLPVSGVLEQERTPSGVTFSRLPAWARRQIQDSYLDLMSSMPSGARLSFRTDSPVLELDVQLTTLEYGALAPQPTFDVLVDGTVTSSVPTTEHARLRVTAEPPFLHVDPGGPALVRIELPGDADRSIEVWLPHNAALQLHGARVQEGSAFWTVQPGGGTWVHYGSSISQCLEAERPTETWPAIAARRTGLELLNLAVGGQCLLDQQIARTMRDLSADVISLKVGTNIHDADAMRERPFRSALHAFLDTVRDGHRTTPIVLITPVHCPPAEGHPGPLALQRGRFVPVARPAELSRGSMTLRRIREIIAEVHALRLPDDPDLHLVDGLLLLGESDVGMIPDGLHPNATGYAVIGERFAEILHGIATVPKRS